MPRAWPTGSCDAEEAASVGRTMLAEAERMERYVADLLALSRLDADDFSLEPGEVDVAGLVDATATTWRDRAARRGVTLESVTQPGTVVTDGTRLRQVLDVLLDNAVRVCADGDRILVVAGPGDDGVRIEVRDSGPGLTPEEAAVAFEPGALHDLHRERAGGAGLGLAIAHRLVTPARRHDPGRTGGRGRRRVRRPAPEMTLTRPWRTGGSAWGACG